MGALFFSLVATLIGTIVTSALTSRRDEQLNQFNKEQADLQNQYNKENFEIQREHNIEMWNMENQYNHPSAQMERLAAAGINKNLAASFVSPASAALTPATATPNVAAGKNLSNPADLMNNLMNFFAGVPGNVMKAEQLKINKINKTIQNDILELQKKKMQGDIDDDAYNLEMKRLNDNYLVKDESGVYIPLWQARAKGQGADAVSQILISQFIPQEQAMRVGKFLQEKNINRLTVSSLEQMLAYNKERYPLEVKKLEAEIKNLEEQGKLREFENQLNSLFTPADLQALADGKVAAAQLISDKIKTIEELDFTQLNSLTDVVGLVLKIFRMF